MNILLELFSSPIPAKMQNDGVLKLKNRIVNEFNNNQLLYSKIESYSTLFRIVIFLTDIKFKNSTQKIKGPEISNKFAIEKFCKKMNTTMQNLKIEQYKNKDYYFYYKEMSNIINIIEDIISVSINSNIWPKNMSWESNNMKWIRPLKNILLISNEQILYCHYGHIKSNNHTYFQDKVYKLNSIKEYKKLILEQGIILDRNIRKAYIYDNLQKYAIKYDAKFDEEIIEEIVGFSETPKILFDRLDDKFNDLPYELLITVLRTHQKYVSFIKDQKVIGYAFIINNSQYISAKSDKDQYKYYEDIKKGHRIVVFGRLLDAMYLYNEDRKFKLEDFSQKLNNIILHHKLGSLNDKVQRLIKLSDMIFDSDQLSKSAKLCKNDLTTHTVYEFPDLRGIIGGYFINDNIIANAIKEYYRPQGFNDRLPNNILGAQLSIIDKIDNIIGLFLSKVIFNSSNDPYGIRRMIIGIIRISIHYGIDIKFYEVISIGLKLYNITNIETDKIIEKIGFNICERLKMMLIKQNIKNNIIESVIDINKREINIYFIYLNIQLLNKIPGEDIKKLARIFNCIAQNNNICDKTLLKHPIEIKLYVACMEYDIVSLFSEKKYDKIKIYILNIVDLANQMLEELIINDSTNPQQSDNRLRLLNHVISIWNKICNVKILLQK